MSRKTLKNLIIIFSAILAAECIFAGVLHFITRDDNGPIPQTNPISTTENTSVPEQTTEIPTTEMPTEGTTAAPTETETEPEETEPKEVRYTLTFTGDCTLGSDPKDFASPHSFIGTIGDDYDFPFRNVRSIFEGDDLTLINLESVLADTNEGNTYKRFNFRGPTAYTQIMTGSSVEAVTLANNHSGDFGKVGFDSTTKALSDAGIWYVEENKTTLLTTESGLVVGLYADSFTFTVADIQKNVQALKDQGAEIIICAFHWGNEGSYRPTADQQKFGKAAIDAGADIVWGHHPHVLQKIEAYGDGVIYYSLGNFSFGGNNFPRDLDSAIIQQEVIRDIDGTVRLGEMTIIPISITSLSAQNNFQPTPCEEGSERYDRVLSKLDGSFSGPDLKVDYSFMDPTEPPTEAPTAAPTEAPNEGGDSDTPTEGGNETPPSDEGENNTPPADEGENNTPPADEGENNTPPADEGGNDTPPADEGGNDTPPADEGGDTPPAEG